MSAGAGAPPAVATQTPQQREQVATIYERSRPGRRAFSAARRSTCPSAPSTS